jgi:hypothetical protein
MKEFARVMNDLPNKSLSLKLEEVLNQEIAIVV